MTENQWSVIPRHPNPKCSGAENAAWICIVGNDLPVPEVEYQVRPRAPMEIRFRVAECQGRARDRGGPLDRRPRRDAVRTGP